MFVFQFEIVRATFKRDVHQLLFVGLLFLDSGAQLRELSFGNRETKRRINAFFGEQFPMTAIGKIQKKVLLEMVREGKITPVDRVRPSRQSSVEQVALAAQPVDTRTARTGRRWPCGR